MTPHGNIFDTYVVQPFLKTFQRLFCHMQNNLRQEEQNEFNMGLANSRVPPTWSVEGDRRYPLRNYVQDVYLWAAATDMDEERQGPAAALRLTGAARAIVREMPTALLRYGQQIADAQGQPLQLTGLDCLVRTLQRRYGALDQETQIFAVSELMQFSRLGHESSDEVLARYEVVCHRAEQVANVAFPVVIKSWMVLTMLRIPRSSWPLLLAPTLGLLPIDDGQYNAMIQYVRRNSHLFESSGDRQKTIQQPYHVTSDADANTAFWINEAPQSQTPDPSYTYSSYESENWSAYPAYPAYADQEDGMSWHSFSTGKSAENNDDLTWDDMPSAEPDEQNEFLYLNYRFHKRRFRQVGFKRSRFTARHTGKGKGKVRGKFGKGKGKGKGFGKASLGSGSVPGFWVDHGQDVSGTAYWTEDQDFTGHEHTEVYFKGKGARKGNPVGKDGRQMKCSTEGCGSTEHFWRQCPMKGKGKGKGPGKSSSTFVASSYPAYPFSPSPGSTTLHSSAASSSFASSSSVPNNFTAFTFLASPAKVPKADEFSTITFSDGRPNLKLFSEEGRESQPFSNSLMRGLFAIPEQQFLTLPDIEVDPVGPPPLVHQPGPPDHSSAFPTWFQHEDEGQDVQLSYHNRVKLDHGESLLVDTGCIDALAGSDFIARVTECARKAGHGTEFRQLKRTLTVEGVGQGSNSCTREAILPISMEDGLTSMHTTSEVPNSTLPGLLGLNVMERRHVVLDLVHKKYIEVGPGGFKLTLPPGSRVLDMHTAPTGHLMLPITEWNKACKIDKQAFVQTADH